MPIFLILAAVTVSFAVAYLRPPGQVPGKAPSAEQLIPLVPRVSSQGQNLRSFAFEAFFQTKGQEGVRTRGWYIGPGRFSLLILDAADDTPLLYASGGKGVVYDALEGRCLPFDYGSMGYFFRVQHVQDDTSLIIATSLNGAKGIDRFDIDLQSLFLPANTTVIGSEAGAYDLTATGNQTKASIRLTPGNNEFWGRCTLCDVRSRPADPPKVTIDIVDVNRDMATKRRALPALQAFAEELQLTKFPDGDRELNRFWEAYLDGFRRKVPAELQAPSAPINTPAMKMAWLAHVLVMRSHFVRLALRHPHMRAKAQAIEGENPIIPKNRKIEWGAMAVADQRISAALRDLLKDQVPLREPRSAASDGTGR